MQHEQLSMFDLFAAPQEPMQDAPAPVIVDREPVPVSIQASMKSDGNTGYRVFGVSRAQIIPSAWRPSASDVLEMFPLSLSYHMEKGLLDRSGVIDLFVHELDAEGNMAHMQADAHVTIPASELYDAAKSF